MAASKVPAEASGLGCDLPIAGRLRDADVAAGRLWT